MPDLRFPILHGDLTQADALQVMQGAGAVAVRSDDGFRLVTASQVIEAAAENPIGALADELGQAPEHFGHVVGNDDAFFQLRPTDPEQLPQFEVPAGYKQCPDNANHTYDIDSSLEKCPHDGAVLEIVNLND